MKAKLPTRTLGNGFTVSALGFGAMGLTAGFYGAGPPPEQAEKVLACARELGVTYVNTATIYGNGDNEKLLGRAISEQGWDKAGSPHMAIGSKFGVRYKNGQLQPATSLTEATEDLHASLARLGRKQIDAYIFRGPVRPEDDAGWETFWHGMGILVTDGLIKHLGLSEVTPNHIRRAHAVFPVTLLEYEWSLFSRELERDVLPVAEELGIGITAYSPLGRGLLSGTLSKDHKWGKGDFRSMAQPRMQGENFKKNLELVQNFKQLAEKKGVTPGQLALAWLLHKSPHVVPIPGTKTVEYLKENLQALKIKLSKEEMDAIEEAVPFEKVAGSAYHEKSTNITYRN